MRRTVVIDGGLSLGPTVRARTWDATTGRVITIPLKVIIIRMIEKVGVTGMGTRVQIQLGQGHFDQLTVALPTSSRIQSVVESFADESLLFGAFSLAVL